MRGKLPEPGAAMQIGDGIIVMPTASQSFARVEVPSNTQAQRLVANTKRKLLDMPAIPQQLNAYAVLLVYTASGLSDAEIGVAMSITSSQIARLRAHDAYKQLEAFMIEAVREQSKDDVTAILAGAEVTAATKIKDLVSSDDEKMALAAAKDVLDRRGHTPKQQIDIRGEMLNTFRIEYVDKRDDAPIIIPYDGDV